MNGKIDFWKWTGFLFSIASLFYCVSLIHEIIFLDQAPDLFRTRLLVSFLSFGLLITILFSLKLLFELAHQRKQVQRLAHDIRGPLTLLMVLTDHESVSEEIRPYLNSCSGKIQEIAKFKF